MDTKSQAVTEDIRDTSQLSELPLRQLQLREIRAMLGLPYNAAHEAVLVRLAEIGCTDRRIDPAALPSRYHWRGMPRIGARSG